jgi:MFS family permease
LITGVFGWHAIFSVNVPLALITALLVLLWVPRDVPRTAGLRELMREVDVPGVVLFAAALLSLMAFLMNLDRPLWWMLSVSGAIWTLSGAIPRAAASPSSTSRCLPRIFRCP